MFSNLLQRPLLTSLDVAITNRSRPRQAEACSRRSGAQLPAPAGLSPVSQLLGGSRSPLSPASLLESVFFKNLLF